MIAIYGKEKGSKKFKILGDGALQTNILYGEYYPDDHKESLVDYCKTLESMNEGFVFEVRPYKGEGSFFD